MADAQQEIKIGLEKLGLNGQELEEAAQLLYELRSKLADDSADVGSSVAMIANDLQAIQAIENITDQIVEQQGLLMKAMQGEDIHDSLAEIKAKVQSLAIGKEVEAQTLYNITKRLKVMKRKSGEEKME